MDEGEGAANVIDAAAKGASTGLQIALNVGAMLLAFVALIAVVNGILGGVFGLFGLKDVTLESLLGYVFSPIAFLIGVPWHEALHAGSFIGQKLVLNEFVAYSNFGPHIGEFSKNRYDYQLCVMRIRKFLLDCDYARYAWRFSAKPPLRYRTPWVEGGSSGNISQSAERGYCRHVHIKDKSSLRHCKELLCMKNGG